MIRINLTPTGARSRTSFRLRMPTLNLGIGFLLLYAGVSGAVGWYWWTLNAQKTQLTAGIDRGTAELATLKTVIGQSGKVKAQLAELRQRIQVIGDLTRNQGRPIMLLDAFVDAVPPDLWITGLEERTRVLKVTGTAFSTTAVSDFMANLRRSGKFKEVDIVVARQDLNKTPRLVTFEVTCRFEG
jgi:Tfp pilus assembly protein PilN